MKAVPGRPLRVLFFIAYPYRMAGANQSLFHLVTHLPAGIHPIVATTGDGPVAEAYRSAGVECHVLPVPPGLDQYGRQVLGRSALGKVRLAVAELLPYLAHLRRFIRSHAVDVVHPNDPRAALIAAPAALSAGRPVVSHLRGEFAVGRLLRRLFEASSRRIIAVSDGARDSLSARGRRKAVTVYNGIGPVAPEGRSFPWLAGLRTDGVVVVTCFAAVIPFKGLHHLIRAAGILSRRGWGGRVAFVCVGDLPAVYGWYHDWLWKLMEAEGVRNVTFTGWTDEPFDFYAHADVSILPSVSRETLAVDDRTWDVHGNEGFPRTHLEAMRFGLPIVGTRIAGVPEQVADGETGMLVEPGNAEELADALEHLINSPELRTRMGSAGRERVERLFSTEAYVSGILEVYREVTGGVR